MSTTDLFHFIEVILVTFGLFIFLTGYCLILWKFNRLPWFKSTILGEYQKKSIVHWEKRSNRIRWLFLLSILLILAFWGLVNVGLHQLTDPFTLIIVRKMNSSGINGHLTLNLIIFGSVVFYLYRAVVPFEIIKTKKISYILLVFAIINSIILWFPNILNHLWYLADNPSLSIIQVLNPTKPEIIEGNSTVGGTIVGSIGSDFFIYVGSYFNLMVSTLQSFVLFFLVIGTLKNQDYFMQLHLERVKETRKICLKKLSLGFERETIGILLSSEEIMVSSLLSKDKNEWILAYYDQRYPGSWYPNMNLFRHNEDVILNIKHLISELKEGE